MKYLEMGNGKLRGKHGTVLEPVKEVVKIVSRLPEVYKIFRSQIKPTLRKKKHIDVNEMHGGFVITVRIQGLCQKVRVYTTKKNESLSEIMLSLKT